MEYLGQLWDGFFVYLNTQPPGWIYFFLFLGAFMENVVPPIPGDALIVFGAYLAGIGVIDVWPAYGAMWVGSVVGCLLVYWIGYVYGRDFFLRLEARYFDASRIEVAETWFLKYGARIVILNRFLPTVRAFVGVVAGIARMNPVKMTLYVAIGTTLWNSLLVYFGLKVGENWQLVITALQTYNQVVISLAVIAAASYYGWKYFRKKRGGGQASGGAGEQESGRTGEEASRRTGEQASRRKTGEM